ncbi:MAG: hypothetical protein JJU42_07025 [Rhodobacteraceae bacterium]|nr:hypothetical protein [Paracoccaceae bacterium]
MTDGRDPLDPRIPVGSDRRGLTLMLGKHPLPGFDVLFRQLLNALAISGHAITHASVARDDAAGPRIEIALDGHLFTLTGAARPADLRKPRSRARPAAPPEGQGAGAGNLLHRPDLPLAALPAARLGLAVLRHTAHCRIRFGTETPESEATAFLRALLEAVIPDAVLWEPGALVLSARELLDHTPTTLAALPPGAPLPLPHPRYERPETHKAPPRRSVFARSAPAADPDSAPEPAAPQTARPGPRPTVAAPTDRSPPPPVSLRAPGARSEPAAARKPAPAPDAPARTAPRAARPAGTEPLDAFAREIRNTRPAHRMAATDPGAPPDTTGPHKAILNRSRRAAVVISSSLCDGLTVAGHDGRQRVIATLPLTTSLGIGLSMLVLMLRTTTGAV